MILTEYDEAEHMEMVKAEGIAEGKAEGIAEGKAEGIAVGKAEILIKILSMKSEVPVKLRMRILAEKDLPVLEKWIDTALVLEHLADFEEQM